MKHLTIFMILASFVTVGAFASENLPGETATECVMMMEQNDRSNPKANLNAQRPKPKSKSSGAIRQ